MLFWEFYLLFYIFIFSSFLYTSPNFEFGFKYSIEKYGENIMNIQRGRELFTKEQRKLFMKYPEDEWEIGAYYTFSKYDL